MRNRRQFGDEEPLLDSENEGRKEERYMWNLFVNEPRKTISGSAAESVFINLGIKLLKVVTVIVTFLVVLGSAVISKGTLLFMISQVKSNVTRPYCNKNRHIYQTEQFVVTLPEEERTLWIWMIIFSYLVPELGTFARSVRIVFFKSWKRPSPWEFFVLAISELAPAIGSALLVFVVLPELDVLKGSMLTNAVCLVPGILLFCTRFSWPIKLNRSMSQIVDIVAITCQLTAFFAWPAVENKTVLYLILPLSLFLISTGWWENYVSDKSNIKLIKELGESRKEFQTKTYFMYSIIAPMKCFAFFMTTLIIFWMREGSVYFLFDKFVDAFSTRYINVTEIEPIVGTISFYEEAVATGNGKSEKVTIWIPLIVWFINISSTYICYAFGKFSCKILIQTFGFALPANLTVPVLLTGLIVMCGNYVKDECAYADSIPPHLFFTVPSLSYLNEFIGHQYAWVWLIWLLSQTWITLHVWNDADDKLTSTELLFFRPMYDAFLIDQSITMNRRKQKDGVKKFKQKRDIETKTDEDSITRIYACGTMWHETKEEMMEFLKSIFRMDEDQCAHKITRTYLQYYLPGYYEFETHIFFDDAFIRVSQDDKDPHLNSFVLDLIATVSKAASEVHETNVKIETPLIYPTPYGGRLEWTLPGKTKMIAHLKDKAKIRPKKRWSQVMYMYYLLGFKIMDNDDLTADRIKNLSRNTYILALDGDIDFKPQAVHLLVDYMKKNQSLGAACGRIHPIGSGAMAWYQVFEYAVGHWLQKATEHVIGCVLCSPGCFSLFRAGALMDDNVMAKYTTVPSEARHYVQYDQGEDRWLCTLLLQRGYRVEYSAASDAYTHCPEGFNEFYNQRRRWMPSTTANILDLLSDYKFIIKKNDNISRLYILYQAVLMIGTAIGPGTIFLMLVGAFISAFKMSQMTSFWFNIAPVLFYILICATCKSDTQLMIAGMLSILYSLVMMTVLIGIVIQVEDDGWLAPSSLFLIITALIFIIAAFMHPQEFYCLKYGVIYYVTVPSMYMLLVIYSIFNMNNVSWGTRDVTIAPPPEKDASKDKKEGEEAKKEEEEKKKKEEEKNKNKIYSFFGNNADNAGSFEFSFAGLFKVLCCTFQNNLTEQEILKNMQASMKELQEKLDRIERNQLSPPTIQTDKRKTKETLLLEGSQGLRAPEMGSSNPKTDNSKNATPAADDVPPNSWFYDGELINSSVDYLDRKEEKFWDKFIEKYLAPLDETATKDKVAKDLNDLRDQMVITFFTLNSLFVLVIFLLNIQQDVLHLNWPLDPKFNFTYYTDQNEIIIQKTNLQLQPIGFVFLLTFAALMLIQFLGMFVHRFGTYSQIMANTALDFGLFGSAKVDDLTEEKILERDPINNVKRIFKLQGINAQNKDADAPVGRRNTAHFLAVKKGKTPRPIIEDLEKAFHTRLERVRNGEETDKEIRKSTVVAIDRRRETIFRRQTELLNRNGMPPPISQSQTTYTNNAFEND
ncbi:unnamed protein product [Phaedon cochleariae]|uniref:chitin synthase n=1 Tax=Phaedon cochleariae TaxID=80249 RepID=A0A9N9SHI4_PHACE|nr:unnamed protein product [Phaedon cochleariae]